MDKPCEVYASKRFERQLNKLPRYIQSSIQAWVASVEEEGVRKVRLLKGYHDEPLRGKRRGERSVRLSRAYRLFYTEDEHESFLIIRILEVNKHDY
ncbi:MAG: hypothetical protein COV44_07325 [Deltaproteobacteria bacterium CG11_big_fil_rev_8_21_14_0_20_45_16]|nr:MAG: hypothetical protein COV44_07325 [Deltaproteobacteria bacterium CG11_big_fil_rev_8_21_14_0_20_45_16]